MVSRAFEYFALLSAVTVAARKDIFKTIARQTRTYETAGDSGSDFKTKYVISLARHGVKATTAWEFDQVLVNMTEPISLACSTDMSRCQGYLANDFWGDEHKVRMLADVLPAGLKVSQNMGEWMRRQYHGLLANQEVLLMSSPVPRVLNTSRAFLQAYSGRADEAVFQTEWLQEYNYVLQSSAYDFNLAWYYSASFANVPDGERFEQLLHEVSTEHLEGIVIPRGSSETDFNYASNICKIAAHMFNERLASAVPERDRYQDFRRILASLPADKQLLTIVQSYSICQRYFSLYVNDQNLRESALPVLSLILSLLAYRANEVDSPPEFLQNSPKGTDSKDSPIVDGAEAMVFLGSHDMVVQFLRTALGIEWTTYQDKRNMIYPNSPTYSMQITLEMGVNSTCEGNADAKKIDPGCWLVRAWPFLPSAEQYPNLEADGNNLKRQYIPMFGSSNVVMPWGEFKTRLASYILSKAGHLPNGARSFLTTMAGTGFTPFVSGDM